MVLKFLLSYLGRPLRAFAAIGLPLFVLGFLVALAVTKAGRDMFAKLGFSTHAHRASGQSITLCYARAGTLSLQRIRRRLSFSGDQVLLDSLCWREGYRSSGKVYARC